MLLWWRTYSKPASMSFPASLDVEERCLEALAAEKCGVLKKRIYLDANIELVTR